MLFENIAVFVGRNICVNHFKLGFMRCWFKENVHTRWTMEDAYLTPDEDQSQ